MKKIVITAISTIFILTLVTIIPPDCAAFRCGSGMVETGDSKARVLITCGKPTMKEKISSKKSHRKKKDICRENGRSLDDNSCRKVKRGVEKWYYNCGAMDFIYVLTFEDGILKKEETEGRGKGKSDCQGK